MVDGFTDDKGKFRPIDKSPLSKTLTARDLLPKKEKQEDQEKQSKRLGEFAKKRVKQFGKGAGITGSLLRAGGEKIKQRQIRKSVIFLLSFSY